MTYDAALDFPDEDGNAISADQDLGDLDLNFSDIGSGNPLWFIVTCSVDGTGAGTVVWQLRTAANTAGLAAGAIILASAAIVGTDHNAGEMVYAAPLPVGSVLGKVRAQADVTGTVGALQIKAFIGSHPQTGLGIRTPIAASS